LAVATAPAAEIPESIPGKKTRKPWPWSEQLGLLLEECPICCAFDELPEGNLKGEYRKAAKDLGAMAATITEIQNTATEMRSRNFPEITPSGIAKWFPVYGRRAPPGKPNGVAVIPKRSVFDLTPEELDRGVVIR